jgi:hypothetical protein
LPDWTVDYGSVSQSQITYNDPALGSTWVSIDYENGAQLDQNCSVLLQGGTTESAASISQTGLVPANAKAIGYLAETDDLTVTLGGQQIPVIDFQDYPNYSYYIGNIPVADAGEPEQLTFSVPEGLSDYAILDDIQFPTSPVPEPSTFALILPAILFIGLRRGTGHKSGSPRSDESYANAHGSTRKSQS